MSGSFGTLVDFAKRIRGRSIVLFVIFLPVFVLVAPVLWLKDLASGKPEQKPSESGETPGDGEEGEKVEQKDLYPLW